jgi:hypothetical protein
MFGVKHSKIENSFWEFVLGDALGVPYEFKNSATCIKNGNHLQVTEHTCKCPVHGQPSKFLASIVNGKKTGKFITTK